MVRNKKTAAIAAVLLVALSVTPAFAAGVAEEEPTEIRMPRQPRQYISPLGQETATQELVLPFSEVVVPGTDQVIVEYRLTIFDQEGDKVWEIRDIQEERRGFFGTLFRAEKPSVQLPDTLVWDGTYRDSELGPDGEVVEDGDYAYQVTVIDYDGNVANTPPFNVTVDNTLPEIIRLEAAHYMFAPIEGSGRPELVVHQEGSSELEWEGLITDADGAPVWRDVWKNPDPRDRAKDAPPPQEVRWDGTYNVGGRIGEPAPEGEYRYSLTGRDRAGNAVTEELVESIALSRTAPEVEFHLGEQVPAFSPVDTGIQDTLSFYIRIGGYDEVVYWKGEIAAAAAPHLVVRTIEGEDEPAEEIVFDGLSDAGTLLPDGMYVARLTIEFVSGYVAAPGALEFEIDTVPPAAAIGVDTKPQPTEPGDPVWFGGERKPELALTIDADEDAAWTGVVYYEGEERLRARAEDFGIRTFPLEVVWDGIDIDGTEAPDGMYSAYVEGVDRAGNIGRSQEVSVRKDTRPAEVKVELGETGGTEAEVTLAVTEAREESVPMRLSYDPDEGIREIFITIRDEDGEAVRTVRSEPPLDSWAWFGEDDAGNLVEDGNYYVDLRVVYYNGNEPEATGVGPIVVDTTPPSVALSASPLPFAPDARRRHELSLRPEAVTVHEFDRWELEILDPDGMGFKKFSGPGEPDPEIIWDGRDEDRVLVESELVYSAVLRVWDDRGMQGETQINIPIDTLISDVPPEIAISVSPIPFAPDDYQQHELTLTLEAETDNEFDRWEVEILEPHGGRSFITFSDDGEPDPQIVWDGRSEDDELVQAALNYTAVFRVWDDQGLMSETETEIPIDILVVRDGDLWRISITSIQFPPNTANLFGLDWGTIEENFRVLRRLAEVLRRFNTRSIVIEGHAAHVFYEEDDPRHEPEHLRTLIPLSQRRAQEVWRALVILGFERTQMSTIGLGGLRPVVPHSNREEVWKNRRVEFILDVE